MDFEYHSNIHVKRIQFPGYGTCPLDVEYHDFGYHSNTHVKSVDTDLNSDTGVIKHLEISGISNIGNTCYANALFQSLASVKCFVQYVERQCKKASAKERKLAKKLYDILMELKVKPGEVEDNSWYSYFFCNRINKHSEVKKTINTRKIKYFFDNFKKFNLEPYQQNCPFELLQGIFETLEELNRGNGCSKDSDGTNGVEIDNPFNVNEVETKICNSCRYTETSKVPSNPFLMIPLTTRSAVTLGIMDSIKCAKPLVKSYFSKECIESYRCDKCKVKSSMTKFKHLTAYPKALLLHFGRKFLNHVVKDKIQFEKELTFDHQWLDIPSDPSNSNVTQTGKRYVLKSIVRHMSFGNGGHYVAYRYVCGNDYSGKMDSCKWHNRWIRVNDDSLREIKFEDTVEQCEAYMAFYEEMS